MSGPWEAYKKPKQEEAGPWSEYQAPPIEEEKPLVTGKGLLKGALESLPMAGSMVGGALGFASPVPGGTIMGAGLGGGAGKALQNIGEKYLLGEEKTRGQIYADPALATLEGTTAEMGGQLIAPAAKLVGEGVKKVASGLNRVPEKAIETYIKRGKDVEGLIAKHGADSQSSANAAREEINKSVQAFKNIQNSKITKALDSRTDTIDIKDAMDKLAEARNKLDPSFDAEKLAKIDDELRLLFEQAPQGELPIKRANALKQRFQDMADYLEPGQYTKKKNVVDLSFERAAADINKNLTKAAPEIREANKNLQSVRRATKNMNRNLLKEGETEASLLAAANGNDKNALALRRLEEITGKNYTQGIEDIAAQKVFADPGVLPGMNTGAALIPMLAGGGYAANQLLEGDLEGAGKGLLLGAAGSPLALKYGIKAARPLLRGARASEPLLRQLPKGLIGGDSGR